jgi:hypothetical protein
MAPCLHYGTSTFISPGNFVPELPFHRPNRDSTALPSRGQFRGAALTQQSGWHNVLTGVVKLQGGLERDSMLDEKGLINTSHVFNIDSCSVLSNIGTVLAVKDSLAGLIHLDLCDDTI